MMRGLDMNWTSQEEAILDQCLATYASVSGVRLYAQIAIVLPNKRVRDVAARLKLMEQRVNSKKRKGSPNLTSSSKYRKGEVTESSSRASDLAGMGGAIGELLRHNAQTMELISANFRANQIQENIGHFCQVRENLHNIMNNLADIQGITNPMPPLPEKLNEELADLILPKTTFHMGAMNHQNHAPVNEASLWITADQVYQPDFLI